MNQTVRLRVNNEIPAYRTGLVSALDVGTSKIVCVVSAGPKQARSKSWAVPCANPQA